MFFKATLAANFLSSSDFEGILITLEYKSTEDDETETEYVMINLNINKEELTIVKKEKAIYRMLSFIEGKFLSESKHSYKLFSNFGKILGQINKELLKLEDEAIESRKIEWDIKNLNWNRKYLEYIEDVETKKLVEYFLLQYNENVFSNDCNLRSSIIHNDANDWNILVNKDNIIGVIDFGDMVKTYMINEVAIALSYILVEKENIISLHKKSYTIV